MFPIKICQAKLQSGFQVAYFHAYVLLAIDSLIPFSLQFLTKTKRPVSCHYENRAPGVEFTAQLQFPNANIFARQNAISQSQRITQRLRSSQHRERWHQGRRMVGETNSQINICLSLVFTLNRGQVVSVTMTEKGKQSGFFFYFLHLQYPQWAG